MITIPITLKLSSESFTEPFLGSSDSVVIKTTNIMGRCTPYTKVEFEPEPTLRVPASANAKLTDLSYIIRSGLQLPEMSANVEVFNKFQNFNNAISSAKSIVDNIVSRETKSDSNPIQNPQN